MDRFLLRLHTGYPDSLQDEREIMRRRIDWQKDDPTEDVEAVITKDAFARIQDVVETRVFVHDAMLDYIGRLVRTTREHDAVEVGPSPRGALALLRCSRALALVRGRDYVTPDDVKDLAIDALAHRIILDMEHVLEGLTAEEIIQEVSRGIQPPTAYSRKA